MLSIQAIPDIAGIRTATLLDQEHTVIPCVALVEGVLWPANAPGPELALAEEFGRFPEGWNGRPVTFGHPMIDDVPVSASSPDVLKDNSFGQIFNTELDGTKLKLEIWINENRVAKLGDDAQTTIEKLKVGDEVVEVSTGLFTMSETVNGEFDGEAYESIWRNIVPDHLAVLPEGIVGACSVEDGCGAPRANQMHPVMRACQLSTGARDNNEGGNTNGEGDEEQQGLFKRILEMAGGVLGFTNAAKGLSDSDVRAALNLGLKEANPDKYFWILAVYPGADNSGTFVYELGWDGSLFRSNYAIDKAKITIGSKPIAVRPVTTFVPVDIVTNSSEQENDMNVEELVNALIANEATQFTEDNREWLSTLEEDQLTSMTPIDLTTIGGDDGNNDNDDDDGDEAAAAALAASQAAAHDDPVPITTDAYVAAAPAEMQAVLKSSLGMHRARKAALVAGLIANARCKFTEPQLNGKDIEELENITAMAPDISYEGAGAGSFTVAEDGDTPPPAPLVFAPPKADAA
jgi:hypothetical protein